MQEYTKGLSDIEYEQQSVDTYNSNEGKNSDNSPLFDIYDCKICKNKNFVAFLGSQNTFTLKPCSCMKIRMSLRAIQKSGLCDELRTKTFENYQVSTAWQNTCKSIAIKYVNQNSNAWLFAGGQSGAGKTHLCTAVCNELLEMGKSVKYILWREITQKLSSNKFSEEYQNILKNISEAEVLYIDDFLKSQKPKDEINWAIDIIYARCKTRKSTIISSEFLIDDLKQLDEATAGRIAERSNGFKIQITKNPERNYRTKGDELI